MPRMLKSFASCCKVQLPLRVQFVHDVSWCERMRRRFMRRASRALALFVKTTMPSATTLSHAGTRRSMPSTSTQQMRHAPISLISFK